MIIVLVAGAGTGCGEPMGRDDPLRGIPARILMVSGDSQTASRGESLGSLLVVRVTDAAGNPVSNVPVGYQATNILVLDSATTDAHGFASLRAQRGFSRTVICPCDLTAQVRGTAGVIAAVTFKVLPRFGIPARILYAPKHLARAG